MWSPAKGKRFHELNTRGEHPDFGTYTPTDKDSHNGSYIVSKFKTLGTTKIMNSSPRHKCGTPLAFANTCSKCVQANPSETPGPGTYLLPSDFGQMTRNINTADVSTRSRMASRRNTVS